MLQSNMGTGGVPMPISLYDFSADYFATAAFSSSGVIASIARPYLSAVSSASARVMLSGGENEVTSMNGRARVSSPI